MKKIFLIILTVFLQFEVFGQSDTGYVGAVLKTTDKGMYICPQLDLTLPISKHFESHPRVGYAFGLSDYDYFYIQNGITYKNKNYYASLYPFWLRRYSREIGYQTPTSILVGFKSPVGVNVEVWCSYWFKELSPGVQLSWNLHRINF